MNSKLTFWVTSLFIRRHIISDFPTSFSKLVILLLDSILVDKQQCLIVTLICVFLVINNVCHVFIRLLPICIFSLEKCLFRSSVHFLTGLFCLLLSCKGVFLYFRYKSITRNMIYKYFPHFCGSFFIFLIMSIEAKLFESPVYPFFLLLLVLSIVKSEVMKIYPYVFFYEFYSLAPTFTS